MKCVSKLIKIVFNFMFWCALIALLLVVVATLMSRISGQGGIVFGNYGFGRVISGSMEPDIPTGSFILIKKVDPKTLSVGDVITFYSKDPTVPNNTPVSHAIVEIEKESDGTLVFTTKGLANEDNDPFLVDEKSLIGLVVYSSLTIGNIIAFSQNVYVFPILIMIMFVSMIQSIIDVIKQWMILKYQSE